MPYLVELRPAAIRFLRLLSKKERARIARKIDGLENDPRPHGVEKLAGQENRYRIRSGDYRIIYEIFDQTLVVLVVAIGHRREIYR